MTNAELLKVIEEAKASGTPTLDLNRKGLTELPPTIGQLTNLIYLNLGDNQLVELPPAIGQLTKLVKVDLWNNRLTSLPVEIGQLINLRDLDLSGNKFNSLSLGISQLANLVYLNLSWNQLTGLPPGICQLSRLEGLDFWGNELAKLPSEIGQLTALRYLNLGHNQFRTLPPELFHLIGLTELNLSRNELRELPSEFFQMIKLIRLDLNDNKLITLPPEIGQLTRLERLHLWDNQLSFLPLEIGQLQNLTELPLSNNRLTFLPSSIGQLMNLKALDLSRNQLANLPPELFQLAKLETLNLYRNKLTALPEEICQLTKLTKLYVNGNKLAYPPLEIARKGIGTIREYFVELAKGQQRLNEVKVILIGEGGAGKTSLVRRLLGEPYNDEEDTTHGISIQGWEPDCGGKQVRVNMWDFGGQVIQHATHQFFLSKRSLYILVVDGRKEDRTEYWLQHIKAFGGDSPVLIVINKIDNNASFDLNRPFLLEKYPGIRDFFRISCKSNIGVADFKESLLTELAQIEMIDIIWPNSWFAVKNKLEEMDRPYIGAEEYKDCCSEAGVAGVESRETLVDFLHDLGVAVHFRGFILEAMHVLDPIWVTNAVYAVITAKKMADSKGFLHLEDLGEILPHSDEEKISYPTETHPFIMSLMQKFELCYELDNEAVLIPQLLSVSEQRLNFDHRGSLRFAFHYPDFLPPSVFPRFIVKVHKDIKENTCWRTGVLLADKRSGALALVKADVEARRINIWVQGEQRREYLHYIRYILTDINISFEKLKIMELVPMPDAEDITADYATLLEYAKNEIDKYIPNGSVKVYSVHELLGLVQPKDTDELENFVHKVGEKSDDNLSPAGLLTELVEPKITVLGITFNLKGFFEKVLAWDKQRQQQSRK